MLEQFLIQHLAPTVGLEPMTTRLRAFPRISTALTLILETNCSSSEYFFGQKDSLFGKR
jgi:hypothetical protein